MSAPLPAPAPLPAAGAHHLTLASSARLLGTVHVGPGAVIAQGAVVRSHGGAVQLGAGSSLLENAVMVGTPERPVTVGEKVVIGHRSLVIGARVGHLCEVGHGSVLLPGASLGDRCFLGEGTVIPPGMSVPDQSVVVGRPGRIIRRANPEDLLRVERQREGGLSLTYQPLTAFSARDRVEDAPMGQLYAFQDKHPFIHPTATLFSSAEVMGDVVIGAGAIIGAGVKILGDAHGPVRIGARVQILENTVLHLLPDTMLALEDGVIIGPGCMLHGCHIGAGSVIEPGAILCDGSRLGRGCHVGAGALVKQRSVFPDGALLEGFPATQVGTRASPPELPRWALRPEDLPSLRRMG
ncbi:UDP-3-O-(3-hydroxymyristoyl) glucosamine N-acyltransferase [Myxococcaceae bacterium JPH2]|nr:UDP-3-O-(3-hydroxymyristoyl) glucosamine N-acyltransferase [Myxococcaceae bacterium JPH2]